MKRRTVLGLLGSAAIGLAGCTGDTGSSDTATIADRPRATWNVSERPGEPNAGELLVRFEHAGGDPFDPQDGRLWLEPEPDRGLTNYDGEVTTRLEAGDSFAVVYVDGVEEGTRLDLVWQPDGEDHTWVTTMHEIESAPT